MNKSPSNSSLNNNANKPVVSSDNSFQERKNALGQLFKPAVQPPAPVVHQQAPPPPPPPQTTKPYQNGHSINQSISDSSVNKKPAPPTPPPRNDIELSNKINIKRNEFSLNYNTNSRIPPPIPTNSILNNYYYNNNLTNNNYAFNQQYSNSKLKVLNELLHVCFTCLFVLIFHLFNI